MADVIIILDPVFGEQLVHFLTVAPVWIIDSDINKVVFEKLHSEHDIRNYREKISITNFKELDNTLETFLNIVPSIQTHYGQERDNQLVLPSNFTIQIIGLVLKDEIVKFLKDYGFTSFAETTDGFEASI